MYDGKGLQRAVDCSPSLPLTSPAPPMLQGSHCHPMFTKGVGMRNDGMKLQQGREGGGMAAGQQGRNMVRFYVVPILPWLPTSAGPV